MNSNTTENQDDSNRIPLLTKFGIILSVFLIVTPIIIAYRLPDLMQASDYLMTFYVVGKLVISGHAADIYPAASATSFIDAPFDKFAHQLLPKLGAKNTAIYMYSPLTAVIFAPFAKLGMTASLIAWQLFCILALAVTTLLHQRISKVSFFKLFGLAALFTPVFHQLLIGHLGIPLGMLPLAAGYYLFYKKHYFSAGLVWALVLLKPQFLPAVLLVVGAFTLCKNFRPLLGLVSGTAITALVTVFCLGQDIAMRWLSCLKLSDTIFSNPAYNYPKYLAISISSVVVQAVPVEMRNSAKLITYGLAAFLGIATLILAVKLIRDLKEEQALPLIMIMGITILPLVLPHFLFYDLCVFAIAAFIIYSGTIDERLSRPLRAIRFTTFAIINYYFVGFFFLRFINDFFAIPSVLVVLLTIAYALTVKAILDFTKHDAQS